jgi:hypothetical protein
VAALSGPEVAMRGAVVTDGTHVVQNAAGDISDDSIEQLIGRMQRGMDICPLPAARSVYCDRDTRCIRLLRELLALRRKSVAWRKPPENRLLPVLPLPSDQDVSAEGGVRDRVRNDHRKQAARVVQQPREECARDGRHQPLRVGDG